MAIVGEQVSDVPSRRRQLISVALNQQAAIPLELRGLRETAERLRRVSLEWQSAMGGMRDDWDTQFELALVAESLRFVGRPRLQMSKRLWYFEVACIALGRFLENRDLGNKPIDPGAVTPVGPPIDVGLQSSVEDLLVRCGHFSGTHLVVAVLTNSLSPLGHERAGNCPWTAVVSFDPQIDATGALAAARRAGRRLHRLVTLGQAAEYRHGSTTWLALGGLLDQVETTVVDGVRAWRRAYHSTIVESVQALGRYSVRPATVVVFGSPDERVRAVVEAIDDRFAERAQVILVSDAPGELGEFVDVHLRADASELLAALPCGAAERDPTGSVPGTGGPVTLDGEDEEWIREIADLVDSRAGASAGELEDVGIGFLRGRAISWFELSLDLDVVPKVAARFVERIREDLAARDTRRIALLHYPGSGGSTLARRAAWQLHHEFPTLHCASLHDGIGLAQRVSKLAQLTGLPVLLILEQTAEVEADRLYNQLRADSIPSVVVVVSRRLDQPRDPGPRSFYLGPATNQAEVSALVQRYGEYAPDRSNELAAVRAGSPNAVPFYFGLVAFQEDYSGLEDYVLHFVSALTEAERLVIQLVALTHRYAGVGVAGDLFANVLMIPPDKPVDLTRSLTEMARGLLVEDEPGLWRTVHWLVAAELLRQLLSPPAAGDQDAWRLALSTLATRTIDEAYEVFGTELPDDIHELLRRLFLERENRELYGDSRQRSFSELLDAIPSLEGRLEVLRQLAERFPAEPHFWAHYGRLLSYEVGDTRAALVAVNRALALDDTDSVVYHIRGIIYRRELRDLNNPRIGPADIGEVLRLTELALADFDQAARLKDDSEYPYVASLQIAIDAIEIAYRQSGCKSHAEFFARPSASAFRALLERAEASIDAIGELRGADPMSTRAQEAIVSLNALYDDYSALLQGWRNLLDRPEVVKAPVRRRLVRVYVRRAGDWRDLESNDRKRILELLEDNLRDDPTDSASLREWLRAARAGGANLDRASELVSYWASHAPSRDSLYYDYVISALQVMSGRESLWREASRKIERCKQRTADFGNRKFSYEWLGTGDGLDMLVHYTDIPDGWDRNRPDGVPQGFRRVRARVASIGSPQAGTLRLESGGLDAFFVPARAGALRGRHENARAEAVIGFSYDGLRAWSVRLIDAPESR